MCMTVPDSPWFPFISVLYGNQLAVHTDLKTLNVDLTFTVMDYRSQRVLRVYVTYLFQYPKEINRGQWLTEIVNRMHQNF